MDKQGPLAVPRGVEPPSENNALDEIVSHSRYTAIQSVTPESVSPSFDYTDVVFRRGGYLRNEASGLVSSIYVFVCDPYVKVGVAMNPRKRLRQLYSSCPHPVRMVAAYFIPEGHAKLAEAYCHRLLMPYHHKGEWFTCEPETARRVVLTVCERAARSRGVRVRSLGKHEKRDLEAYQPPSLRIAENAIQKRRTLTPSPS